MKLWLTMLGKELKKVEAFLLAIYPSSLRITEY